MPAKQEVNSGNIWEKKSLDSPNFMNLFITLDCNKIRQFFIKAYGWLLTSAGFLTGTNI